MSGLYDQLNKQIKNDGDDDSQEDASTEKIEDPVRYRELEEQIQQLSEQQTLDFEQLNTELAKSDKNTSRGITPLDIADLPGLQKKIMFAILRNHKAARQGITVSDLESRVKSTEKLDPVLAALTNNGWLLAFGESPNVRYKVNIRARRGSSVWTTLSSRILDSLAHE